jgi:type I restriction enzyme S subunit
VLGGGFAMKYSAYPAYKDSGVEWLGEIPEHWEVKKFRYCAKIPNGQIDPRKNLYKDMILIAPNHIESGTGRVLYKQTADEQGADSGKYLFKKGDVLYSKIRPALKKACLALEEGLCSADMYPLTPQKETLSKFLLFVILSEWFTRFAVLESERVAMPKVNRESLNNCFVVLPPQKEQQAIASFLDRETAKIDALIAKKERLIELLQEKRTAIISHAVTKGLDPTVQMKDSGVEWLEKIPTHWQVKRIRAITESIQTGPFGSQLHSEEYVSAGIPVINPSHLKDGRIEPDWDCAVDKPTWQRLSRHELREGDIIFARRGEMGRCALVTAAEAGWLCGTGSLRMRLKLDIAYPQFLNWILSTSGVRDWLLLESVGATMDNLNTTILARVPLSVPPFDEQVAIASYLDRETAKIDALIAKIREGIEKLKEYRTALISSAVTGKIDVRELTD